MLSKRFRFHSRGGVKYVYRHGQTVRHTKLSLVFCDNSRGFQRFAVVVSKKVDKRAVVRNRIRRRVYEAVRLYKNTVNLTVKKDFVFVIYSASFATCPFSEIEERVAAAISEALITPSKNSSR